MLLLLLQGYLFFDLLVIVKFFNQCQRFTSMRSYIHNAFREHNSLQNCFQGLLQQFIAYLHQKSQERTEVKEVSLFFAHYAFLIFTNLSQLLNFCLDAVMPHFSQTFLHWQLKDKFKAEKSGEFLHIAVGFTRENCQAVLRGGRRGWLWILSGSRPNHFIRPRVPIDRQ